MKTRSKLTTLLAGLVGIVFTMYGSGALAVYAGSAHEFAQGWALGETCTVCHTPHGDATAGPATQAPLWDHAVNVQTYTPYSSITGTLDGTMQTDFTGISKLCLTCHDGTLSMDNFGGATTRTGNEMTNPVTLLGTDLTNEHPVSFVYNSTILAGDTEFVGSGTVLTNKYTYGVDLTVATVECVSCHDVHNTVGEPKLLRQTKGTLCQECHLKQALTGV